jgi:hypothetical protein
VLDDAGRLGLGRLPHLGHDLGTLLARLLADACGLVTSVGELLLQLGELGVGLGLLGLGRGDAALDRLRALGIGLLETRGHELPDEEDEQAEDDERQGELDGDEAERVLRLRGEDGDVLHAAVLGQWWASVS